MTAALTDAEIHRAAKQYMFTHRVGYTEALNAVVSASPQASNYSEAVQHAQESPDARLDAAAQRYAQQNHVNYSEALHAVVATFSTASFNEAATYSPAKVLENQQIEIFKAGVHIDGEGVKRTYTLADVQRMASAYSPTVRKAVLTVGHPDDDKPVFGYAKKLAATNDGRLMMQSEHITPAFAESIKVGAYKKRSASFYTPSHPSNPVPGSWYLKHVGWLGGQPPAIAGLADVAFGTPLLDGQVSFTA